MLEPGIKTGEQSASEAIETAKLGIWTFLATEVLLFGGLFTAYTVFRIRYPDMFQAEHLKLNKLLGLVNTVVLICSSLSVAVGIAAIRKGRQEALRKALGLTIVSGLVFLCVKFFEYAEHFRAGEYPRTDIFFSLYFMMTGLHGLHVIAGMLALSVVFVMARKGRFSESYSTPVEITGIYWHFVDLVWIYLFPLLYLTG